MQSPSICWVLGGSKITPKLPAAKICGGNLDWTSPIFFGRRLYRPDEVGRQNATDSDRTFVDSKDMMKLVKRWTKMFGRKTHMPGDSSRDLFGMVKWPFQGLSDLQLEDKKVTLNHLVRNIYMSFFELREAQLCHILWFWSMSLWGALDLKYIFTVMIQSPPQPAEVIRLLL